MLEEERVMENIMNSQNPSLEAQDAEHSQNYQAFKKLLKDDPDMLVTHKDKYALMRHKEIIKIYDTIQQAIVASQTKYKDGLFSIQKITNEKISLGSGLRVMSVR